MPIKAQQKYNILCQIRNVNTTFTEGVSLLVEHLFLFYFFHDKCLGFIFWNYRDFVGGFTVNL